MRTTLTVKDVDGSLITLEHGTEDDVSDAVGRWHQADVWSAPTHEATLTAIASLTAAGHAPAAIAHTLGVELAMIHATLTRLEAAP